MFLLNYFMVHNTNPVTGWRCGIKREVVGGKRVITTMGPMQITNHFGGARSTM